VFDPNSEEDVLLVFLLPVFVDGLCACPRASPVLDTEKNKLAALRLCDVLGELFCWCVSGVWFQ
jgi:hypothetical protein